MMEHAIYIGRFQPLHDGHVFVIETSIQKYGRLTIVIGSAQHGYTRDNPLTAGERYEMIKLALEERGLKADIIPVEDAGVYPLWVSKVKSMVPDFKVVVTGNATVSRLFLRDGYRVDKWHRQELPSGEFIRQNILEEKTTWKQMVPKSVLSYMLDHAIPGRIRDLNRGD